MNDSNTSSITSYGLCAEGAGYACSEVSGAQLLLYFFFSWMNSHSQIYVVYVLLSALKAFGKHNTLVCSEQMEADMEGKKTSDNFLELLAVNNQWDQQFRWMKQQYEKKVTDVKGKLEAMQKTVKELERERHRLQEECKRLETLTTNRLVQDMAEEKRQPSVLYQDIYVVFTFQREIKTLKEENRLLRDETALANTKKMHYECEINRLNKVQIIFFQHFYNFALLGDLENQTTSSHVPSHVHTLDTGFNEEEMRLQMEVLMQQVQIYEEDFKKERSDRERLNSEKEALQKINARSQSQLNRLNSKIKYLQDEKELLQNQVKQQAQDLQALAKKHGFPHHLASNIICHPCLSCRNCGLLHPYLEPQITLASRGINPKQQEPPVS
ncbi:hypothetical protein JD844_026634 [Phrynosoma platyrhinos]|uniref:NF-kappa-B essential modulator NEMO CC2-LZ domain-containing protein n=1 Tax=Phrynosoma platyrhinos TaxID=52577 RepID=A0ABQ7SF59_PHRPL|nr:hypothetical protein JD844_026634 [Phrynosoma platyrhinos]